MNNITERFFNSLPEKPYCSNNLGKGIKIKARASAINHKYIQPNHPQWLTCFIFDIDKDAYSILQDITAKPNIVIFNPEKRDSGHFFYLLNNPIPKTKNSKRKPIRFYEVIRDSMTVSLKADPAYRHFISKTPHHRSHITQEINPNPWDLHHLADHFDLSLRPTRPKNIDTKGDFEVNGRNDAVFEVLRNIAYRTVVSYREKRDYETFFNYLKSEADKVNESFKDLKEGSMTTRETLGIVKSVARWTWNRYTPVKKQKGKIINIGRDCLSNTHLTEQEKKVFAAIKTNESRKKNTQDKIDGAVRRLHAQGIKITQKAIQEQTGLGIATIKRRWKSVKK